MAANAELKAENEFLKLQLEEHRFRELESLRERVATAEHAAEHFKAEAHRNADAAKQLVPEFEKKIAELQSRLDGYEQRDFRQSNRRPRN